MNFLWKKPLTFLLAVSLMLTGCSPKHEDPETTAATAEEPAALLADSEQIPETTVVTEPAEPKMKLINVDGILYAEDLGAPVLGQEKVQELYQTNNLQAAAEAITNVGDALCYLREAGEFEYSWDACGMFYDLLAEDYETVQTLKFCFADHSYDLMYIRHDGVYHIFDPFNLDSNWLYDSWNDCVGHTDFNLLCEKLVTAFSYESTATVNLETPGDLTRFFAGYPAALVEPVLGQEKVEALYNARNEAAAAEAITTVGDALYYLVAADMHSDTPGKQPRDAINLARKLLSGDYEAVDCLGSAFNDNGGMDLLLVQYDGMYYVFDLFNLYGDWTFRASNNCQDQDLVTLMEKVFAVYPYEGTNLIYVFLAGDIAQRDYGTRNANEPYFDLLDTELLQRMNGNRTANMTQPDILKKFEVYDNALVAPVLGQEKVKKLYDTADLEAAADTITNVTDAFYYLMESTTAGTFVSADPREACALMAQMIGQDYDSMGYIDFNYTDSFYRVFFIEYNGAYYAFDPFRPTTSWILKAENECFVSSDLNDLGKKLTETFPFKGNQLRSVDITRDALSSHGAEELFYHGNGFPAALGQPQLSDDQIDALAAETDYEKIAQTIKTLPDAVNFLFRAEIEYRVEVRHNMINGFNYHRSAWQVLKDRYGQCVELSNLMHYLLLGDYDEVGYVCVGSARNGHTMVYIYEDGFYYLIDPSEYGTPNPSNWLGGYTGLLGCSKDFRDIASSLTKTMVLEGERTPVNSVFTATMPGDFVASSASDPVNALPIGAEAISYYGNRPIVYRDADYEWDTHTRID